MQLPVTRNPVLRVDEQLIACNSVSFRRRVARLRLVSSLISKRQTYVSQ